MHQQSCGAEPGLTPRFKSTLNAKRKHFQLSNTKAIALFSHFNYVSGELRQTNHTKAAGLWETQD